MQRLVYSLAYPVLWVISKLPFSLFYLVSDVVFFIVFYLVRYRRKTVRQNLELVFPEKPLSEVKRIEKDFYKHMVDMFLEMIKSISISEKELKKRFLVTNPEMLRDIHDQGKSVLLACGHYASYEWMSSIELYDVRLKGFGIYKKVKNKYFDQMVHNIRGRFHTVLIPSVEATRTITANEKAGIRGIYAMISDQSPRLNRAWAWTDFMGINAPIFMGTEVLARRLDMAVLYLHVEKVGRGYYRATFKTITLNPIKEEKYKITRTYTNELEAQIRRTPEYYLWTHKRWKHRNAPIPEDAIIF